MFYKIKDYFNKILFISGVKFHSKFFLIFIFVIIISLLEFIGLGLFIALILSIFEKKSLFLESFKFLEDIKYYQIIYVLLVFYTTKFILQIFFQVKIYSYLFNLHYELSNKFMSSYLKKPYIFFVNNNSSKLIRNIYSEIGIFTYQIIIAITILIADTLLIMCLLALLLINDFKSTVIIFGLLSFFYFLYYFFSKSFIKKWGQILIKQKYLVQNSLKEIFNSIKEIKIFNVENFFIQKFSNSYFLYSKSSRNQSIFSIIPKFYFEYIIILIFVFLIIFLQSQNFTNDQIFTSLTLFAAASIRMMPCFARIATQTQSIIFYKPTVDILYDEIKNEKFDIPLKENDNQNFDQKLQFNNTINIENLYFGFPGKKIFEDVNVSLPKNKILGIFGKSGEGKTTFINLICGLIEPQSGKINLDGKFNINQRNIKNIWLKKIGYIAQDIYLLNDTIKNNIIFGSENFDIKRFNEAVINSQFEEVIKTLDDKEDTIVGENGINFSGGQVKRLAIARALYRNPELLILDETTSSLDGFNEKKIFDILNKLKKNICIIVISHNKETLNYCDKIYEVDKNKIYEKN